MGVANKKYVGNILNNLFRKNFLGFEAFDKEKYNPTPDNRTNVSTPILPILNAPQWKIIMSIMATPINSPLNFDNKYRFYI